MWRFVYVCLLRLHPRHFRQRFAAEMLWIFDEAGNPAPLLADAVKSLARQWAVRSDAKEQPAPVFDGVPRFYTCGGSSPRPAALINGGVAALAIFAALALAITYGGGRASALSWTGLGYGSPRYTGPPETTASRTYASLSPSLWYEVKEFFAGFAQAQPAPAAAVEPPQLTSAPAAPPQLLPLPAISAADLRNAKLLRRSIVVGNIKPAPAEPAASYAYLVFTLDTDGNGRISKAERSNAVGEMFRELLDRADQNHDGFVTREELQNEIRRRADTNRDGFVTWEELDRAVRSGKLPWPGTGN